MIVSSAFVVCLVAGIQLAVLIFEKQSKILRLLLVFLHLVCAKLHVLHLTIGKCCIAQK